MDPKQVIKRFGLKTFGGRKDIDWDGVPNSKDCQPKNPFRQDKRNVEIMKDGRGMVINNPDGIEVHLLKRDKTEFKNYARDLAITKGLDPGEGLNSYLGTSPLRITIKW